MKKANWNYIKTVYSIQVYHYSAIFYALSQPDIKARYIIIYPSKKAGFKNDLKLSLL